MTNVGKRNVWIVSVTIEWSEEKAVAEGKQCIATSSTAAQRQKHPEGATDSGESPNTHPSISERVPGARLLPSDRVVLNALIARVLHGGHITTTVRTKELEAECEISRRQVQICLRRLSDKGLIKRLIDESVPGNTGGYRYKLSKDALNF